MAWLVVLVRRLLWIVLIGAAGGAAYTWWRDRDDGGNSRPAEWPPLTPQRDTSLTSPTAGDPALGGASITTAASPVATSSTASVVNSLVDAPEARSAAGGGDWIEPDEDGSCPLSHPIKANDNSGIFHVPDGRFYARTRAERCYADAEHAVADGYRRAKN